MKLGKMHSGNEFPKKSGWYLRDYRNPPKETKGELPPFSVDKFLKAGNSGFWYVIDADYDRNKLTLNDAWYESLPWCKIKSK